MNKIKYIPVFALTALLSSCGVFGGKAPKFADSGEEVKYEYFINELRESVFDSEVMEKEVKLTDRVYKLSEYERQTQIVKRGKKEISKNEMVTSKKSEAQYDVDNFVAKVTGEQKVTMKANNPEGNGNYTISTKTENYYQMEKESGTKYLMYANTKTQEYRHYEQVSSVRKADVVFDDLVRRVLQNMVSQFNNYVPMSGNYADDYLFYIKDDSLFTLEITKESDDDYTDEYDIVKKTKLKVQLDITDKKQSLKVSNELTNEYTYVRDYLNYRENDVITETSIAYYDYSMVGKNVNLSAIDISDYLLVV